MHLKMIKIAEQLLCEVDKQMECIESVNTKEMGEVIDMIKDLSEAIYYDVVTESMLGVEEMGERKQFIEKYIPATTTVHPSNPEEEKMMGHSPWTRKTYMEHKQNGKDKTTKLRVLEKYAQELTSEIVEMIEDATPEERQLLERRISSLAAKINQA